MHGNGMEGGKGEGSAAALSEQVGRRFFDEITLGEVDAGGFHLPEDLLGFNELRDGLYPEFVGKTGDACNRPGQIRTLKEATRGRTSRSKSL